MSYEKPLIIYKNFEPDKESKNFFFQMMQKTELEAPSDSNIKLTVKRIRNGYKAYCRLASSTLNFGCHSHSNDLHQLCLSIEKSVKRKIEAWRKNRVLNWAEAI